MGRRGNRGKRTGAGQRIAGGIGGHADASPFLCALRSPVSAPCPWYTCAAFSHHISCVYIYI
jgi:hypothetical protein